MNSPSKLGWIILCVLAGTFSAPAVTVNDGSTTTNLIQIANSSPDSQGSAEVHLDVTNTVLKASQTGASFFFSFRSAWYASDLAATGGVYTVTTDFNPAAHDPDNRYQKCGGVMGWLNLASSNGIAFQVFPDDFASGFLTTFRVSLINFSAESGSANDSFDHLFNLNGTAATGSSGSALAFAAANYSVTNFATFQLAFTAPSAADQAALTNRATAHVTAKVLQTPVSGGAPVQVGPTIDLLTDLPLPAAATHRFGYFAFWGSTSGSGDIGYLDNLTAQGAVGSVPNIPPMVTLTAPLDGSTFTAPASINITGDSADSDGLVTRVDLFAGATLLATSTNNAFSFTWNNVPVGNYAVTARATDDRGATSTSAPVNVTVTGSTGGNPTMMISFGGGTIVISWETTGFQLQSASSLSPTNWADISINTLNTNQVTLPIASGNMFFRLIQSGAPGGPKLSIQSSGSSVVVSWPAQFTDYTLQSNTNLSTTNWVAVSAPGNQATEMISGSTRFYRLIKP
jgi:hypothetical protein